MNSSIIKQLLLFFAIALIEIFLVSRMEITYLLTPSIYLFFIIQLPIRTPKYQLLLLAFLTGFVFDIIFHTGGIHAASTTLAAFVRILIIPAFLSAEDYDNNIHPGIYTMGTSRFLFFTFILVYIHHFAWFMLEIFKIDSIWITLFKTVLSAVFSVLLIYIIGLLFYKKKRI